MRLKALGVLLVVCSGVLPALGQAEETPVKEANFENDQIRIVHTFLAPHESRPVENHPRRFMVFLTPSKLRLTYPDGTSKTEMHNIRDFAWSEPVRCGVENLSDSTVAEIDIEFKQDKGPGMEAKLPAYTDPLPAGTETEPVPVDREPRHHPVFRNQYAEVLNVTLGPGETFLFHRHPIDHVAVEFESVNLNRQQAGKDWVSGPAVYGHADYANYHAKPVVHRVSNVDKKAVHVLDFEIAP